MLLLLFQILGKRLKVQLKQERLREKRGSRDPGTNANSTKLGVIGGGIGKEYTHSITLLFSALFN